MSTQEDKLPPFLQTKEEDMDRRLIGHAINMLIAQDMCHWSDSHDRVTIDALRAALSQQREEKTEPEDDRTMRANVPARPILYTDTIDGQQCMRDDMWAVTTAELNALAALAQQETQK